MKERIMRFNETDRVVSRFSQNMTTFNDRGEDPSSNSHHPERPEWADIVRADLMVLGPFEEGAITETTKSPERSTFPIGSGSGARSGTPADADVERKLHETIRKVGDDAARLSRNPAIVAMTEHMNTMRTGERTQRAEDVQRLCRW